MRTFLLFALMVLAQLLAGCGSKNSGFPSDNCDEDCLTGSELFIIQPAHSLMLVGASSSLSATVLWPDGRVKDVTAEASWRVSDEAVATLDTAGTLTATGAGSAVISATLGDLTAQASVVVSDRSVAQLFVSPANRVALVGMPQRYSATAVLDDQQRIDVTALAAWSVSDTSVATIDGAGVVTAAQPGRVDVIAELRGLESRAALVAVEGSTFSLTVEPANMALPVGLSQSYLATLQVDNQYQIDVTDYVVWNSTNPSVAAVGDASPALITALSVGASGIQATLSYRGQSLAGQGNLQVTPAVAEQLWVSPASASVPKGVQSRLQATAIYSDGAARDVTHQASWVSSNPSAVSVVAIGSDAGTATALAEGASDITARFAGLNALSQVTVTPAVIQALTLAPKQRAVPLGSTVQYYATAIFSDGSSLGVSEWSLFTSSDDAVARIEAAGAQAGLATTGAEGSTTMSVTYQGFSDTAILTVSAATMTHLAITPPAISVPAGARGRFTAIATYSDGAQRDVTEQALWQSDDPAIMVVDSATEPGEARALQAGSAAIVVAFAGQTAASAVTVTPAQLTSLQVEPQAISMLPGGQTRYVAYGIYSDGSRSDVTRDAVWVSSDNRIVELVASGDTAGLATARLPGEARVTAFFQALQGMAPVTVIAPALNRIEIQPEVTAVFVGASQQYRATAIFDNGRRVDVSTQVTWQADDDAVASIDAAGHAQGVSPGSSAINASMVYQAKRYTATAHLNVLPASYKPAAFNIEPYRSQLLVGMAAPMAANIVLANGAKINVNTAARWQSLDTAIAAVDQQGQVFAVSPGRTEIVAQLGEATEARATVVVIEPLPEIELTLKLTPAATNLMVTQRQAFVATAHLSNGQQFDVTSQVAWSSNAPNIAPISQAGVALGLSEGLAKITAAFAVNAQVYSAQASVTVSALPVTVSDFYITPPSAESTIGGHIDFSAQAVFSDASVVDVTADVNWQVQDTNIAVISRQGQATGVGAGQTQVIATWGHKEHTYQDAASLTIAPPAVVPVGLSVSPYRSALFITGQQQYRARLELSNGQQQDVTQGVVWASSDMAIAGIDQQGLALGIAEGAVAISARYLMAGVDLSAQANLVVRKPEEGIADFYIEPLAERALVGTSVNFRAYVIATDSQQYDVTEQVLWQSGEPEIAVIDAQGRAVAQAEGTAGISATYVYHARVYQAQASLTAVVPELTGLRVAPVSAEVLVGEQQQYQAYAQFAEGPEINVSHQVSWQSSDRAVANVNQQGLASTQEGGSTIISAHFIYSRKPYSAQAELQVNEPPPTLMTLSVSPIAASILPGTQQQYRCVAAFSDNSAHDVTEQCGWTVDNTAIADIDAQTGLLTSNSEGSTVVTARFSYQGVSAVTSTSLTVLPPLITVDEIQVTPAVAEILSFTSQAYTATALLSDGRRIDVTGSVLWQSDSTEVARVNQRGVALGVTAGDAQIQASLMVEGATYSGAGQLTVLPPDISIEALRIVPPKARTYVEGFARYRAQLVLSNNTVLDITERVTWSADSQFAQATATAGEFKGVQQGITQIEASLTLSGEAYRASAALVILNPNAGIVGIEIAPSTPTLPIAGKQTLAARLVFEGGQWVDITTRGLWTSADAGIATVSPNGELTGLSAGEVVIQKTLTLPGLEPLTAQVTATVVDPATELVELRLSPQQANLLVDHAMVYQAIAVFADGSRQDVSSQVSWGVADASVAQITDPNGTVIGKAAGQTQVSARYTVGDTQRDDSADLTVEEQDITITELYITPEYQEVMGGGTVGYAALIILSDYSHHDVSQNVVWRSSDNAVASPTEVAGNFLTQEDGQATLSATLNYQGQTYVGESILVVLPKQATYLEMAPTYAQITEGARFGFQAIMHYSNNSTADVTEQVSWASSNPLIADVSSAFEPGVVSGISQGSAIITALDETGLSAQASVNIVAPSLQSIAVYPANTRLSVGQEQAFTAIGLYDNGSELDLSQQVLWQSDNSAVAQVLAGEPQGQVAALAQGGTTIRASLNGISGSANLTVTPAIAVSLAVAPAVNRLQVGDTQALIAVLTFSDNTALEVTQSVTWVSANTAVASVSNQQQTAGQVLGLTAGTSEITAHYDGGFSANASVVVVPPLPSAIEVSPATVSVGLGAMGYFTATAIFSDGSNADVTAEVEWQSSNAGVATVNNGANKGFAESHGLGQATISAYQNGVMGTASVTVIAACKGKPNSVYIVGPETVLEGEEVQMQLMGVFDDGCEQNITHESATVWDTSNANVLVIGHKTGVAKGIRQGSAEVSVKYRGETASKTVVVTE